MNMRRALITLGFVFIACFSSSCDQMAKYKATIASGMSILPWPRQIEALFGDSDNFITHYDFDSKPKLWNTEVFFGGRYVLTFQVDVEIDYSKNLVVRSVDPPRFYLKEIKRLVYDSSGKVVGADFEDTWSFDETQWAILVATGGNWSAIGVPVRKNDPLFNFDQYVKLWRSPRLKIR